MQCAARTLYQSPLWPWRLAPASLMVLRTCEDGIWLLGWDAAWRGNSRGTCGIPSEIVLQGNTLRRKAGGMTRSPSMLEIVTWLILPVVICLSQRLSHACLSINEFILWNCEWLIKSVIVYLMISCYMDNCGNSRANTCWKAPTSGRGVFIR
jgi:ABC-type glucose/galactose transport system permease subunit